MNLNKIIVNFFGSVKALLINLLIFFAIITIVNLPRYLGIPIYVEVIAIVIFVVYALIYNQNEKLKARDENLKEREEFEIRYNERETVTFNNTDTINITHLKTYPAVEIYCTTGLRIYIEHYDGFKWKSQDVFSVSGSSEENYVDRIDYLTPSTLTIYLNSSQSGRVEIFEMGK